VTEQFRRETKLSNLVIGFGIAALLNLQPIPVGGLLALTGSTQTTSQQGAHLTEMVPLLVNLLEWSVVALSTLFGAQLWFSLLKFVVSRGSSGGPAPPLPAATTPPGAAPQAGEPGPQSGPPGPAPQGGDPGPAPQPGAAGPRPGRKSARRRSRAGAQAVTPAPQSSS
jgi:hypothetical protein